VLEIQSYLIFFFYSIPTFNPQVKLKRSQTHKLLSMDYEHTMQLYDQAKQKKQFLETAEYLDYKKELKWLETVKSKRTGEFFQAENLKRREMVPADLRLHM
jgi:hypothetical protein